MNIDEKLSNTTINGTSSADNIENEGRNFRINGKGGRDKIEAEGTNVTINGGAGGDKIEVDGRNIKIFGNSGNDSISVEGTNVTVFGGVGNDTIKVDKDYNDINNIILNVGTGNDVVRQYQYSDKVKLVTGDINSVQVDGNDVVFYTNEGSVRVRNRKNGLITTVNSSGIETTQSYGESVDYTKMSSNLSISGTTMTANSSFSGSVWLDGWDIFNNRKVYGNSDIVEINATATNRDGVILAGNAKNNIIRAGGGDTQLWGGFGGNDTLFGGADDDIFWYGKGNGDDIVRNFTDDDMVMFYDINLSEISSVTDSGSQMKLNISGGGSLTVNYTGNESEFQFANGAKYEYNHRTKSWQRDN